MALLMAKKRVVEVLPFTWGHQDPQLKPFNLRFWDRCSKINIKIFFKKENYSTSWDLHTHMAVCLWIRMSLLASAQALWELETMYQASWCGVAWLCFPLVELAALLREPWRKIKWYGNLALLGRCSKGRISKSVTIWLRSRKIELAWSN